MIDIIRTPRESGSPEVKSKQCHTINPRLSNRLTLLPNYVHRDMFFAYVKSFVSLI